MTKLEKAVKTVGAETVKEMEAMSTEQLKARIVEANEAMRSVAKSLEDNSIYQEIKADKSAMESGLREVNKRQNAIIFLALTSLNEAS